MTYEEKLKLAKEALDSGSYDKETIEYIFPELKESEDEKMMNQLHSWMKEFGGAEEYTEKMYQLIKGLLEKQGEHANFINKIQIGDKVTRNEDGVLVNLSQLNRVAKKQGEQKSAWSKEDEKHFKLAIDNFQTLGNSFLTAWLKSLKERVQPQQERSEEEEKMLNLIIARLHSHSNVDLEEYSKEYDWLKNKLKSLRTQSQWKPSDEQMNGLEEAIEFLGCTKTRREQLQSLYEQLKKLKG